MEHIRKKQKSRVQRKKRIRRNIFGTGACPRMSVYRSLKHCYVQLIDDGARKTILGFSTLSKELRRELAKPGTVAAARTLGRLVAEKALAQQITRVVFDRNGFIYHGRIKALAEGAREKGLHF